MRIHSSRISCWQKSSAWAVCPVRCQRAHQSNGKRAKICANRTNNSNSKATDGNGHSNSRHSLTGSVIIVTRLTMKSPNCWRTISGQIRYNTIWCQISKLKLKKMKTGTFFWEKAGALQWTIDIWCQFCGEVKFYFFDWINELKKDFFLQWWRIRRRGAIWWRRRDWR